MFRSTYLSVCLYSPPDCYEVKRKLRNIHFSLPSFAWFNTNHTLIGKVSAIFGTPLPIPVPISMAFHTHPSLFQGLPLWRPHWLMINFSTLSSSFGLISFMFATKGWWFISRKRYCVYERIDWCFGGIRLGEGCGYEGIVGIARTTVVHGIYWMMCGLMV